MKKRNKSGAAPGRPTLYLIAILLGALPPTICAAPGDVDASFNPSVNDAVLDLGLQNDCKTIIGGQFTSISGVTRNYLARLNTDGSLDTNFMNGLVGPNDSVTGVGLRSDGKILVKGYFNSLNGTPRGGLALVNADGTLDNTFAPTLTAPFGLTLANLCVQPDDKVVVGGTFTTVNGAARRYLARLKTDGSLDSSFLNGLSGPNNSEVYMILRQTDGKLLIGGGFTSVNGAARTNLARLNADGSLDTSFLQGMSGPNAYIERAAIQADGKILIAGGFTAVNGLARTNFTRLNADGSVDLTFNYPSALFGVDERFKAIVVQPDGDILVARHHHLFFIALFNRLHPNGSADTTFAATMTMQQYGGMPTVPSAVALQPDGKILVGGPFTVITQSASAYIARLMGQFAPLDLIREPQTQTAEKGASLRLNARAAGYPPPFYLWFANEANLIGWSTNNFLDLTNLQFSQSGNYTVVVTNVFGAITSSPAAINIIPAVARRSVPAVQVVGETGSSLNLECADSINPPSSWFPLDTVSLTSTSQFYFDLTAPLPPQRFYRAWQMGTPSVAPSLNLNFVPAITLTGSVGSVWRVDGINSPGPIDAWVALATVTLTNTTQLYLDVSAPGQSPRLYRIVNLP